MFAATEVVSLASKATLVVAIILRPVLLALITSIATKGWLVIAIPKVSLMHIIEVFTGESSVVMWHIISHHFTTKVPHHLPCSVLLWVVTTHHLARTVHHHGSRWLFHHFASGVWGKFSLWELAIELAEGSLVITLGAIGVVVVYGGSPRSIPHHVHL